jgi:hypothetical protein
MGAQWKAKHKEAAANAKGRTFGKLSKEIMIAARSGADPDMNPRLRLVVEQAKKASMPRETLERAIKKGAGLLGESVHYERTTYEGFAPHQVPVIVECLTDNVNRTVAEIRVLFRKGQRRKGLLGAFVSLSLLGFVAGAFLDSTAREAGFADYSDQLAAQKAGFPKAADWAQHQAAASAVHRRSNPAAGLAP